MPAASKPPSTAISCPSTKLAAGEAKKTTAAKTTPAKRPRAKAPRAITMWDFSWLERRWTGAGYEDWDVALDQLVERGYDAVRIDAYPHFFLGDPAAERTLVPIWNQHAWGSPDTLTVRVQPALIQFIAKCKARGVKVGLSSWFREDTADIRMKITGPAVLAQAWLKVLDAVRTAGLLDSILYVDLCNEWPLFLWAPWFDKAKKNDDWGEERSLAYMRDAIAGVRAGDATLPLFFSAAFNKLDVYLKSDYSHFDAFDQHIWMTQANGDEFYNKIGYEYEKFDPKGYHAVSTKAAKTYRERPKYWQAGMAGRIDEIIAISRKLNKPLISTECWSVVDYKDWPGLEWDWIKELCALGTQRASASGRWLAIATSNFCGPQFAGMWRDVAWHRRLTDTIKRGPVAPKLKTGRLWEVL